MGDLWPLRPAEVPGGARRWVLYELHTFLVLITRSGLTASSVGPARPAPVIYSIGVQAVFSRYLFALGAIKSNPERTLTFSPEIVCGSESNR